MADVDLGGNTTPIPADTWGGPEMPEVVTALLRGDNDGAFAAFVELATQTEVEVLTFPQADRLDLINLGRINLAELLEERGLFSADPTVTDQFFITQ